jgi:multiple antibiotic resistance protein
MLKEFWLCFVPLFVAVDPIGLLPMFLGLTSGLDRRHIHRVIYQSLLTASIVAMAFLAVGTGFLRLLGITVADFLVAGGLLLLLISITDLLSTEKRQRKVDAESLGAVPLGVPLLTGPAVLTTSIVLINEYGVFPTAAAILVNIAIAGVVFRFADGLNRILGKAGAKIVSKIASLLLAAIAVMLIRRGIAFYLTQGVTPG